MIRTFQGVPFSILELALVNEENDESEALQDMLQVAKKADKLGFHRFWLAEHHNMPGVASSATSILIGHVAEHTERIRVGSGGVMLPNHAPLIVAEQFGTLETLYPNRIDIGIGRAPGTDQATAYALRRSLHSEGETFPELLAELRSYFEADEQALVKAIPGMGLKHIPIWLLGSSDYSARLAASLGLPFSFASHFAPQLLYEALRLYREQFKPSEVLNKPQAMVAVNIVAADTDEEANYIGSSLKKMFLHLAQGISSKFQPPTEEKFTAYEEALFSRSLDPHTTIIGSKETVERKLNNLIERTEADELIISSPIYDLDARLRSLEIIAQLFDHT
ncbi:MAG TPA: LLM class flavin-dependent oxidoreductase [Pseudogracilibacillus sp.]|nr:LLM class flavin-dependent oxidoreductase [Pseudogracilibacillus sp.]